MNSFRVAVFTVCAKKPVLCCDDPSRRTSPPSSRKRYIYALYLYALVQMMNTFDWSAAMMNVSHWSVVMMDETDWSDAISQTCDVDRYGAVSALIALLHWRYVIDTFK